MPPRCHPVLLAVLLLAAPARAAPDPMIAFLAKNRCAVADRLSRLYDAGDPAVVGYDARADTVLAFEAPFAPGLVLACDPVG